VFNRECLGTHTYICVKCVFKAILKGNFVHFLYRFRSFGLVSGSMDPEPIYTRIVDVAVVGLDVELDEEERLVRRKLDRKELKRVCIVHVHVLPQQDRLLVLLRLQAEDVELPGRAVDPARRRHALGDVLQGELIGEDWFRQLDDNVARGSLEGPAFSGKYPRLDDGSGVV